MLRRRRSGRPGTAPVVRFLQPDRVDRHIASQRYYLLALSQVADVRVENQSLLARPFPGPDQKAHAAFRATLALARSPIPSLRPIPETGAHGRYVAEIDGAEVRFAIDCVDQPEIREIERASYDWSDIYFKANRRRTIEYDAKVLPLVNSNGWLNARRVAQLRALRATPKDIDVSFVSNVWGGREHNVRLFEQLGRLRGRTELKAIFPPGFDPEETEGFERRLAAAGVPSSDRHVPLRDLTRILARSKIVFFRAGKAINLPWRTIDLLALGSCVVIDSAPVVDWYVPLRPGVNFVDCGIERALDTSPAPAEQYEAIVPTIESLLADESRMEEIRQANARYFDDVCAPLPLGRHILDRLRAHVASGAGR